MKQKNSKAGNKAMETGVEVLAPGPVVDAENRARIDGIMQQVHADIGNAELGRFFALRAGVGLVATREYMPHGDWGAEIARAFPNRSERTIRRYMSEARDFLAERKLLASDVWHKMVSIDQHFLSQAAGQLLIGNAGTTGDAPAIRKKDMPKELVWMADYLNEDAKPAEAGAEAGRKGLSPTEKRMAAQNLWQRLAATVTAEGIARKSWQLLDPEEQETVASALRTSADEILRAVRKTKQHADTAAKI